MEGCPNQACSFNSSSCFGELVVYVPKPANLSRTGSRFWCVRPGSLRRDKRGSVSSVLLSQFATNCPMTVEPGLLRVVQLFTAYVPRRYERFSWSTNGTFRPCGVLMPFNSSSHAKPKPSFRSCTRDRTSTSKSGQCSTLRKVTLFGPRFVTTSRVTDPVPSTFTSVPSATRTGGWLVTLR